MLHLLTNPYPGLAYSLLHLSGLMLHPRFLGFLIRHLTQRLPLLTTDTAHTQSRLLQHLHVLQRTTRLTQLPQLLKRNGHGELLAELDVD